MRNYQTRVNFKKGEMYGVNYQTAKEVISVVGRVSDVTRARLEMSPYLNSEEVKDLGFAASVIGF